MGRRNIYLGSRVPDVGGPGLDKIVEVEGIAKAIYEDYVTHKISYNKAIRRLNLLSLIVSRDQDFDSNHPRLKTKALNIIDHYRSRLMKRHYGRRR
jgi:hypothetical protein